ncbi:protein of unknown function [Methanoculleus bourgensis]|uniref:Uncharacterized protein n=1 Tax=Methanoculleus bourgensis TaxID=83986 RepID=A0A0X3BPC8_9EURY|nr:protein of unknown function [Methanoculleus bourgensis]
MRGTALITGSTIQPDRRLTALGQRPPLVERGGWLLWVPSCNLMTTALQGSESSDPTPFRNP